VFFLVEDQPIFCKAFSVAFFIPFGETETKALKPHQNSFFYALLPFESDTKKLHSKSLFTFLFVVPAG